MREPSAQSNVARQEGDDDRELATMTALLALTGNCLAAVFLLPQLWRLRHGRDARGVSPTWLLLGVATNAAWVAYLGVQLRWAPLVAPAVAAVVYGVMVLVLVPIRGGSGRSWTAPIGVTLAYATGLGGTAAAAGLGGLGLALACAPIVQLGPELRAVYRQVAPRGVSPATWILAVAEASCWAAYGADVGDAALLGYGVVNSVGALAILVRWWVVCGSAPAAPIIPVEEPEPPQWRLVAAGQRPA